MPEETENQYPRQGLGTLTEPLHRERGEHRTLDPMGKAPPGQEDLSAKSADLLRQTDIDEQLKQGVSKVAPHLFYGVGSVYDSRPVQARDFIVRDVKSVTVTAAENATFPTFSSTFTVNENFIGVLRHFRLWWQPAIYGLADAPATAPGWLRADILIDDTPVPNYVDMRLGTFNRFPIPCFVLADELTAITLRISQGETLTDTTALGDIKATVFIELYGNELMKTGIPKEFQIANRQL